MELTGHGKLCEGASENLVWRHVRVPHCSHPYQLSSTVRRDAVRYDLLVKVAFANFRSEVHMVHAPGVMLPGTVKIDRERPVAYGIEECQSMERIVLTQVLYVASVRPTVCHTVSVYPSMLPMRLLFVVLLAGAS